MAEKKKAAKAVETVEEKYLRAGRIEQSMESLLRNKEKAEVYRDLAKLYESLGDYEDSGERAKACSEKAAEFEAKVKQQKKEQREAEKEAQTEEKKERNIFVRKIVFGIIVLLIILLAAGFIYSKTEPGRYTRASFYEKIGNHKKAYLIFKNLKDYKDSEDRSLENRYLYAENCANKHRLKEAKDEYRALGDYKDSHLRLTDVELANIRESEVGTEVLYGECRWLILEKEDPNVFLVKSLPVNGVAYNDSSKKKVSWKNCTLRKYLNHQFMEENFCEEAANHIITTTVEVPKRENKPTETQHITMDQLFLLNAEQAEQYQDILSNYLRDWWLINPGANKNTAQFVSYGKLMKYGYDMSDRNIYIRPAMWISLD